MSFQRGTTLPDTITREVVPCAYASCTGEALVRVYTPTGWANLCRGCYAKDTPHRRPQSMNPVCKEIREAYQRRIASPETAQEAA